MKKLNKLMTIFISVALAFVLSSCAGVPIKNTLSSNSNNQESTSLENTVQDTSDKNVSDLYGELKIHYLDVGQADCILLQQGNENMLIDAGNNDDEKTIKNYLQSIGVTEFKYVIGTHPHEDHIGSLDYIMNSFKVGKIYFPKASSTTKTFENLVNAVKNRGMKFTNPMPGETFNLGNAKCTILAPNNTKYEDLNNYSIVLKVEYGNNSFLFTGDAEDVSEKEILSKGYNIKADVFKVGHHGSKSSTTQEFLNKVNPKYAVISVGKGNDYGHPNNETIDKLNNKGISIYRTDESGVIICTSDGNNISFNTDVSQSTSSNAINAKVNNKENSSASSSISKTQINSGNTKENNLNAQSSVGKDTTVWIANNSSKIYHNDKSCSKMQNPVQMKLQEAQNKGLRSCKKCYQ